MSDKEENTGELTEDQKEAAKMIESLSQDILNQLEAGNMDVDIQLLMDAIEAYAAHPNYNAESVKRWRDRIGQITKLLEVQYAKVQEELKEVMKNNPKISAYDKANSMKEDE